MVGWRALGRVLRAVTVGLVVVGAIGSPRASADSLAQIDPKVVCVWRNADDSWLSVWQYKNTQGTVTIAIPSDANGNNYFSSSPAGVAQNLGQPTTFVNQNPSTLSFVFAIPATYNQVTWNLSSKSATATKPTSNTGGNACASQPVPVTALGGWMPNAAAVSATMGATLAVLARRSRRSRALAGAVR